MPLVITHSETRTPICPHFGICGGCLYQDVPYPLQLASKEKYVQELFKHEVAPILGCQEEWRYRNKMEFSFSQSKSLEKFLGLMIRKKRGRVENLSNCFLVRPWFAETLQNVRAWWLRQESRAFYPPTGNGLLANLTLREGMQTDEKMAALTIVGDETLDEQGFLEAVGPLNSVIVRKKIAIKKQPTRYEERVLFGKDHIHEVIYDAQEHPWRLQIGAASFFQPNTAQAQTIYQKVVELGAIEPDELVFDLYCGTGTIGMFVSKYARKVIGIECVEEAVVDARVNIFENKISNMEILEGDVADLLETLEEKPDTLIVDPPRIGLSPKALQQIIRFEPKKILYISCNPVTQVENCRILQEAGYRILHIQPIDQFPQTPHLENIVVLQKRKLPFQK